MNKREEIAKELHDLVVRAIDETLKMENPNRSYIPSWEEMSPRYKNTLLVKADAILALMEGEQKQYGLPNPVYPTLTYEQKPSPLLGDLAAQLGKIKKVCLRCGGEGYIPFTYWNPNKHDCPLCHGTGLVPLTDEDRVDLLRIMRALDRIVHKDVALNDANLLEGIEALGGLKVKGE